MSVSVAILGGRGYLGSHIGDTLSRRGNSVWIVGRQSASDAVVCELPYRSSIPSIEPAVKGADCVIHVATLTTPAIGEKNPYLELDNIRLTLDLIKACESEGVSHIVFASTGGTMYGETGDEPVSESAPVHPSCSYAIAKYASEEFLRGSVARSRLSVTVLRISNIYGGRQASKGDQGFIGYAVHKGLANEEIRLYGNTVRDYIYIDDVVSAFVNALRDAPGGFRRVNVSTGIGTSLVQVVTTLQETIGRPLKIHHSGRRTFDLQCNVLANRAAQFALSWRPTTDLSSGLKQVVQQQLLAQGER